MKLSHIFVKGESIRGEKQGVISFPLIKNLQVLLVVEQFNTVGSGGLAARHLSRVLSRAGASVCVYCMSDWGLDTIDPHERADLCLTLSLHWGGMRHFRPGPEIARFRSLLKEFKPDVVDFCSLQYAKSRFLIQAAYQDHARLVARPWIYDWFCVHGYCFLNGKPCSLCASGRFFYSWIHGCGQTRSLLSRLFSYPLLRRDILRFDSFLSTSQAMDQILIKYGVTEERIVRASVPFDPQRIADFTTADGDEFVFYGQLKDFKGAFLLPEVIKACPSAKFVLRPLGASQEELQKYRDELSQMQNVTIDLDSSWIDWLGKRVAISRAVLAPSLYPMSPEYTFMEALGLSKPIVAFDVGAHHDLLVHKENAMVVPHGDWRAFADAVHELDVDPQLRHKLSEGARYTFEQLTSDVSLLKSAERAYARIS